MPEFQAQEADILPRSSAKVQPTSLSSEMLGGRGGKASPMRPGLCFANRCVKLTEKTIPHASSS